MAALVLGEEQARSQIIAEVRNLVGSNTAWCHPVVYQRIMAARAERGTKLVDHDRRYTLAQKLEQWRRVLPAGTRWR